MPLVLVGTSHHLAPVEFREQVSFDAAGAGEISMRLAGESGEAVALSTCNRTSLYVADEEADVARDRALGQLAALSTLDARELESRTYTKVDEEAALHLFRVASGLDSMIPGEGQILGQVRGAYEAARERGSVGPLLDRLFRQALHVGKRVRNETALGDNPGSVSSAAVELAASVFGDLTGREVLVLGAGKMAELTVLGLISRGVEEPVVANRSRENAVRLAQRVGGRPAGLEAVEQALETADIVLASTGATGVILRREEVEGVMMRRRGRPVFFIDIAVPRDLDPSINGIEGCYLYDIDDLKRVVDVSVAGRREEAAKAEAIVLEESESYQRWLRSLEVVPAIASLRAMAEDIRSAELERASGRLGALSERDRNVVEALTTQIVNKLLHLPTVRMKEAPATEGVEYAEAVRFLFGLGEERR